MIKKPYPLFYILLCLLICVGCGKDTVPSEPKGSLEIKVLGEDGVPEPNASVTTVPETKSLNTDDNGTVIFKNIPVGQYTVTVNLSEASSYFQSTPTLEIKNLEVERDMTESFILTLPKIPDPIAPTAMPIESVLNETYRTLGEVLFYDTSGYALYWGDIGTDMFIVNTTAPTSLLELDTYNFTTGNSIINDAWEAYYKAIRNTNLGIEAIEKDNYTANTDINEDEVKGEFKFLRALFYFNLLKLYGNPVLVTMAEFDMNTVLLQDRDGVLSLVEEDLKFAEAHLAESGPKDRASRFAAQALLGKFYMYLAGFPDLQTEKYVSAMEQFEKLTNHFDLEPKYADVFDRGKEDSNSEVIFSVGFDGSKEGQGGNVGVFWGPKGYALEDYLLLDAKFVKEYFVHPEAYKNPIGFPLDIEDNRFFNNIAPFIVQNGTANNETDVTQWRPLKFIDDVTIPVVRNGSSLDVPYLRYADILLMLAEAENAVNGPTSKAYNAVNTVIDRSFPTTGHELPVGLGQREFLLEIIKQRRLELCLEGHIKDDLIRNQLLEEVISDFNTRNPDRTKQYDSHKYIWPIPQSEINLNPNIVQNPGY